MAQQTRKSRPVGWLLAALLLVGAGGAWYALDPGFQRARAEAAAEVPADDFGQRVREYLLANPEVIVEAMQALEARRLQAENGEARSVLAARSSAIRTVPSAATPKGT